ncbi:MAG: exosortase-associated EpsI family protein [Planctomycetes bacterium]|nr:exosortase-associated EpsI family protein [Planctomycetota bacterium]
MNKYSVAAATAFTVVLTVGAAIVQGRLSGTWNTREQMLAAVDRLMATPANIGAWEMQEAKEPSQKVKNMLECAGFLQRTYLNRTTGDVINVAVIIGPRGPTAVHTPEICYSSRDYVQETSRERVEFKRDDAADSLWKLDFRPQSLDAEPFTVYYGYCGAGGARWEASESPRWEYAGQPFLYKLQLAGRSAIPSAPTNDAACKAFLEELLPVLHQRLRAVAFTPSKHRGL